jgi:hypothetical protein
MGKYLIYSTVLFKALADLKAGIGGKSQGKLLVVSLDSQSKSCSAMATFDKDPSISDRTGEELQPTGRSELKIEALTKTETQSQP